MKATVYIDVKGGLAYKNDLLGLNLHVNGKTSQEIEFPLSKKQFAQLKTAVRIQRLSCADDLDQLQDAALKEHGVEVEEVKETVVDPIAEAAAKMSAMLEAVVEPQPEAPKAEEKAEEKKEALKVEEAGEEPMAETSEEMATEEARRPSKRRGSKE